MTDTTSGDPHRLERIVNKLSHSQSITLGCHFYHSDKPVLLLDNNYRLFFATKKAEQMLGYSMEQIVLDTNRLQTDKKQGFDTVARIMFERGKKSFDLHNVSYRSTDDKYQIVMDLHFEKMDEGGICVTLGKVERYEAAQVPRWHQFSYKRAIGDQVVVVPKFVDPRNDDTFTQQVGEAYVSVRGKGLPNKLVIDLTSTRDIIPKVVTELAALAHENRNVVFVNPTNNDLYKKLLDAGINDYQIQRKEPETKAEPSPSPEPA